MNPTEKIRLSDESRSQLIALCRHLEKVNPDPESLRYSRGIADYLSRRNSISEKQAQWLNRNADYHKIARPPELRDLMLLSKQDEEPDFQALANQSGTDDLDAEIAVLLRIVSRLKQQLH